MSAACDHCYAESWAKRTGQPGLWTGERRRTTPANWQQPIRWNKAAAATGERHRVFCASLADVFDNQVPGEWRCDLFDLIFATPHLDWLLLTKRPQNIMKMVPWRFGGLAPKNVWLGTTVENQAEADRRIPHLLRAPAAVRFLSCEPLLGPIDLTALGHDGDGVIDALRGEDWIEDLERRRTVVGNRKKVDWVITGGESGPGARPMYPDWARSLRDQCAAAGVPFFFKQWGGLRPKTNGRLLDGAEHSGYPRAA